MNGASAHITRVGAEIIIMGFELSETPIEVTVVTVDETSQFDRYL